MSDFHEYKVDTIINLHLSIGWRGSILDSVELGELIDVNQQELDGSSKSSIDRIIHEAMQKWTLTHIDMGWSVGDEPRAGE